jgi:hypothetical protein
MAFAPRFRARILLLACFGLMVGGAVAIAAAPSQQLLTMALLYPALFLLAWWIGDRNGVEMLRLDHPVLNPPGIARTLAVVPALTMVNFGGTWLLYYPISLVWPEGVRSWLARADSLLPPPANWGEVLLLWVSVIVFAPIAEELVFRGLLLHRWCARWGRSRGILATTALFALFHASPLGIFLLALGLTGIYLRTGSLRLSMMAHGLNNLLAFVIGPLFSWHEKKGEDPLLAFQRGLPLSLMLFIAGASALWVMRERWWPAPGTPMPYDRRRSMFA